MVTIISSFPLGELFAFQPVWKFVLDKGLKRKITKKVYTEGNELGFQSNSKSGTMNKVIRNDFLLGREAVVPTRADEASGRGAGDTSRGHVSWAQLTQASVTRAMPCGQ